MIVPSAILLAVLTAASIIDLRTRRLPDWLTLPLIVSGLATTAIFAPDDVLLNMLGAALGFIAFGLVARLYRSLRGYDGLGLGDAKLLAVAGAWLGPLYLAPVVFVSAILAIACALILRLYGREVSFQSTLPFGPFLSVGIFLFWYLKIGGWPLFG
jgi:leader peptidase (prepilin peptidase)/N-methyltransferase